MSVSAAQQRLGFHHALIKALYYELLHSLGFIELGSKCLNIHTQLIAILHEHALEFHRTHL